MSPDQRYKRMEFNGTFLATIVTFIVFVLVMNKILYAPILGIMEERRNFIDSNYKDAQDNDKKSEELNAEREDKLNSAKDDARSKYIETVDEYKSKRVKELADANSSAVEKVEQAENELNHVSDEVKDALKGSMTNLASDIVEKIIGYRSEVQGFDNEKVSSVLWGADK